MFNRLEPSFIRSVVIVGQDRCGLLVGSHFGRPIPIGPLMKEHVLIAMMVNVIAKYLADPERALVQDVSFVNVTVDFFRTYADKCHHGKEEDILFRELAKKPLSNDHYKVMSELVEEHRYARETVRQLNEVGQTQNFEKVAPILAKLVEFYPDHIVKEDKHFFYPVMSYFSQEELEAMLKEFYDFDRRLIHEKYEKLVKSFLVG